MNDKNIMVSVIMLAYNHKQYISQAIESVLNQKRSFDIEFIINDDCSQDETPDIIREYWNQYPNIIVPYFQKENIGAMNSFYFVQSKCKGKYIMACSGDDYWLPNKMSVQIEYMEKHPNTGMCYGSVRRLYNDRIIGISGDPSGEQFYNLITRNTIPAITICRRLDISKVYMEQVKPEDKPWIMEDLPMWLWFSKNSQIDYINEEMAVYRIIQGSLSHPDSIEKKIEYEDSKREVLLYFIEANTEYRRLIECEYEHSIANAFLRAGDIKEYRIHNNKSGSLNCKIKNIISYLPYGKKYLCKRLKG